MASLVAPINPTTRVLDLGSGYGGAARQLAKTHGCHVTCLNISEVENLRNIQMNKEALQEHQIAVKDGSFEMLPFGDGSFDLVWSQDAFLHSGNRSAVLAEIDRVLVKENGKVIFSDFMTQDNASPEELGPILDRLHLESLGSLDFYRKAFEGRGFRDLGFEDHTTQMRIHYKQVLQELLRQGTILDGKISNHYVQNMTKGLNAWIHGAETGTVIWGIMRFGR